MMGKDGPSNTAYPRASHTRGDIGEIPVKRFGESRSCPAASALLNSRGYAHMIVGNGPSLLTSYPGGVYRVAFRSTPSALLYRRICFGGSTSEGCGCGKSLMRRGRNAAPETEPPSSSEKYCGFSLGVSLVRRIFKLSIVIGDPCASLITEPGL
jgi:hypothetical protein